MQDYPWAEQDWDPLHDLTLTKLNNDIALFQAIHNSYFGAISNKTVIIVVQVHDRISYLSHLISSLAMVTNIHNTLIIFSHDVWDEKINNLISSIEFTQTLQIFYPYSIQTHPHIFPGTDPADCHRDARTGNRWARIWSSALNTILRKLNCTNSAWPDLYGHYREAPYTQVGITFFIVRIV